MFGKQKNLTKVQVFLVCNHIIFQIGGVVYHYFQYNTKWSRGKQTMSNRLFWDMMTNLMIGIPVIYVHNKRIGQWNMQAEEDLDNFLMIV